MAIFYTESSSFNDLKVTGSIFISASRGIALQIRSSGSTIFSISGSGGEIFNISDVGSSTSLFTVSSGSINILNVNNTKAVSVSGSLQVTGSAYIKGLDTTAQTNVITIDTASGQLYYTASSAIGGGGGTTFQIATGSITASVNVATSSIFQITSGSSTFMIINNSGSIGIGTTTPTYSLDIRTSTPSGSFNANNILYVGSANVGINTTASSTWNLDVAGGKFRVGNNNFTDIFTVGVGSGTQGYCDMYLNGQTYTFALYTNPQNNSYTINGITYSTASVGLIAGGNSAPLVLGSNGTEKMRVHLTGDISIGSQADNKTSPGYRLNITGSGISGSLNANNVLYVSGSTVTITGSTNVLKVIGSGSVPPIFTVQGSQGELFSVTDSLSGSLFSVNDISGLPILDVNSDQTTKIGSYLAPGMYASARVTANTGVTVIYSIPTASYDSAYFDYNIRSGSVGRAGSIIAMRSGSSVNYSEVSASSFGTTNTFVLGVSISGSNMILSGSAPSNGWTVKTIIRSI
jgi:hypothetical protein